jgi:2,3-bisphosphoglycerate-dependent phosphoglycerate mutase
MLKKLANNQYTLMRPKLAQGIKRGIVGSLFSRALSTIKWAHLMLVLSGILLISGCQQGVSKKIDARENLAAELSGVYYLIRHSEKDRSNPENDDPELTSAGRKRADLWRRYFDSIPLSGIYSTGYKRTLQTIIPTAASKSLNPIIYPPHDLVDNNFIARSNSGHWLIVGHSNTVPELTNTLMNIDSLKDIPDSLNSRLYRVDYRSNPAKLSILHID